MEILRCLNFFALDYFLIAQVDWQIGQTMFLLLRTLLWSIRIWHLFSLLFWLVYWGLGGQSVDSTSYTITSKRVEDKNNNYICAAKRYSINDFLVLFSTIFTAVLFYIASMSNINSCHIMFNNFYY